MRTSIVVMLMLGTALFGNLVMGDEDHAKMKGMKHESDKATSSLKQQSLCPVMGGKINKKFYADVKGKRIYVCCPGCISKIKKDPEKYIKILKDKGQSVLEMKQQAKCPVMKKNKINKNLFVDAEGKRIYVCCKGCIGRVKKDPKKYIKELEGKGVTLEDIPKK